MKKSETIIELAKSLLKAQKEIGSAKKAAINPFFRSKYADLGSVMETCKEALNNNGITVLQPIGSDSEGVYVETVLLHESGEFIADRMRISVKAQNDPQAQGSAITYARRYSLQSMVFIPAEDDDAEKATDRVTHPVASSSKVTSTMTTGGTEPICTIHNKPMKQRTAQNGGHYYDHRWQENGVWQKCDAKPKTEEDMPSEYEG